MRIARVLFIVLVIAVISYGIALPEGRCQYLGWPNIPFMLPFAPLFPFPYYNMMAPVGGPAIRFPRVPTAPVPFVRSPNATIILASGLTGVSTTPGVIVIGAPTAVNTAAVVTPTTTVPVAPPAPAPLFSILTILYASALYAPALLSTANPLLFATLSTLFL